MLSSFMPNTFFFSLREKKGKMRKAGISSCMCTFIFCEVAQNGLEVLSRNICLLELFYLFIYFHGFECRFALFCFVAFCLFLFYYPWGNIFLQLSLLSIFYVDTQYYRGMNFTLEGDQ